MIKITMYQTLGAHYFGILSQWIFPIVGHAAIGNRHIPSGADTDNSGVEQPFGNLGPFCVPHSSPTVCKPFLYGLKTANNSSASDECFAPSDGVSGKGTFKDLFRELCVKDLGGGNFDLYIPIKNRNCLTMSDAGLILR